MNILVYSGNVASTPDVKLIDDKKLLTSFTVAVKDNRNIKLADGKDRAIFIRTIAWDALAKICAENLQRGNHVTVHGRLNIRGYVTNGKKQFITECIAECIDFTMKNENVVEMQTDYKSVELGGNER